MANNTNYARKRSKNLDSKVPNKKRKLISVKVDLPNEIWTKIMNYLPTIDIFKNFGLVSKRFHGLIGGIKYLQVKNIDNVNMCHKVIEIVNNHKALIELELDFLYTNQTQCSFTTNFYSNFVNQAINQGHRLKSLKIRGPCYISLDLIEILKQFGNHFQHLAFEKIQTTQKVLLEICELKSLKSLELSNLNCYAKYFANKNNADIVNEGEILNSKVIQALANSSMKLESINLQYVSMNPRLAKAINKFFNEKKDTLKKVRVFNSLRLTCDGSFENLNQCKNLEDVSGSFHFHEYQHTQLKRLECGNTILTSNDLSMFKQINFNNLQYLKIPIHTNFFGEFAKLQFPALQYLVLELFTSPGSTYLNNKSSKTLMKNSQNLKTVKFIGPCISNMNLVKIFNKFGPITLSKNPTEITCLVNSYL